MAVQFNTNETYGYQILALFGVPTIIIETAKAHGVKMDMASPGNFTVKAADGSSLSKVPIKTQAISLAKAGSMGPASMETIRAQLISAISTASGVSFTAAQQQVIKPEAPAKSVPKVSASDILAKMTKNSDSQFVNTIKKTAPIPPDGNILPGGGEVPATLEKVAKKHFSAPCKLADATQVYQPVTGTSKTSVYYVVALLQGLKLAIRSGATSLSMRAEGSGLENYQASLNSLGFSVKGNYASVHFDCTPDMTEKTVGAVIGGLGMANLLQAADVKQVMGK